MKSAHSCQPTTRHSSGDIRSAILFGAQHVPVGACPREYSDTLLGDVSDVERGQAVSRTYSRRPRRTTMLYSALVTGCTESRLPFLVTIMSSISFFGDVASLREDVRADVEGSSKTLDVASIAQFRPVLVEVAKAEAYLGLWEAGEKRGLPAHSRVSRARAVTVADRSSRGIWSASASGESRAWISTPTRAPGCRPRRVLLDQPVEWTSADHAHLSP